MKATAKDKATKALEAEGSAVRGVFRVFGHPRFVNIVVCDHNANRSKSQILDDLHAAETLLRAAGFTAWRDGWTVCARG